MSLSNWQSPPDTEQLVKSKLPVSESRRASACAGDIYASGRTGGVWIGAEYETDRRADIHGRLSIHQK